MNISRGTSALQEMLLDKEWNVVRFEPTIEDLVRQHDQQGPLAAETVASSRHDSDLIREAVSCKFFFQGILDVKRAASHTARASAQHEFSPSRRHCLMLPFLNQFQERIRPQPCRRQRGR